MANYTITVWSTGDLITSTKLANIETGINNLTIAGTTNQVLVNGATTAVNNAAITLTLPQSIAATSTPTFADLTLQSDAALVPIFATHAAGDNTQVTLRRSRGTQASPTDVADGDALGMVIGQAYSGGYLNTGRMQIEIDGTFTSGQRPPSRIAWYTNTANAAAAERMRLTAAGNFGLGVTPKSTWASGHTALQYGGTGSLFATTAAAAGNTVQWVHNGYYDGAWKRIVADEASRVHMNDGTINFDVAASSTADSAIAWTTVASMIGSGSNAMRIMPGSKGMAFTYNEPGLLGNLYYSSGYKFDGAGYGGAIAFDTGTGAWSVYGTTASGAADGAATLTAAWLKVEQDGDVVCAADVYANSTSKISTEATALAYALIF